jgi:hypothetical protein
MNTHLSQRRLSQAGFVTGVLAGGLAYLAVERHEIAFLCFVIAWYLLAYGLPRGSQHPEHRLDWVAHIALFPMASVIAAVVIDRWLGSLPAGVALGLVVGFLVQAAGTKLALRRVAADQLHDLRHKLGIE